MPAGNLLLFDHRRLLPSNKRFLSSSRYVFFDKRRFLLGKNFYLLDINEFLFSKSILLPSNKIFLLGSSLLLPTANLVPSERRKLTRRKRNLIATRRRLTEPFCAKNMPVVNIFSREIEMVLNAA